MALERRDRVKDQTQSTGTGTVTVDGVAPAGYRTIASAHTSGATVRYTIVDITGAEWEVGEGVWTSSGATLTRATVYSSSNGGSLVNFSAGAKAVFTGPTARDLTDLAGPITVSSTAPGAPVEGNLWYHTDTGKLFVYYNDGSSSQWVSSSSLESFQAVGADLDSLGAGVTAFSFELDGGRAALTDYPYISVFDGGVSGSLSFDPELDNGTTASSFVGAYTIDAGLAS